MKQILSKAILLSEELAPPPCTANIEQEFKSHTITTLTIEPQSFFSSFSNICLSVSLSISFSVLPAYYTYAEKQKHKLLRAKL